MSKPYNAAHWDGSKWTLKKITVNFRGYSITPPIQGIFAFSSNQIWLAGGLTIFGNGTNWTPYDVRLVTGFDTLDCEKGWGSNSSSMFFVGRRGSIAHFNGSSWTTMPSSTTVDLQDIWGIDATHIWVTGTNVGDGHSVVLQCDGSNWTTIYDSNTQPYGFGCLWTNTTHFIYLDGGSGLYKMTLDNYNLGSEIKIGLTYLRSSIHGINNNDIFDVTAGGEAAHYNGSSWHYYLDIQAFNQSGAWFTRVYPTSNFVLIGGWYLMELNGFPVVIRGYR
jgi:hypothetical protein